MERTSIASFWPQIWQRSLHIVLVLLCLWAAPASSTIDTLVVLHTNDFHGYISSDGDRAAGLARIATYFNHERARSSKVLALASTTKEACGIACIRAHITARHIWTIHPFGNQLAIVQIFGKDIGGKLLERLTAAGTALDPDHLYTVATNSFVVEPPRRELFIGTAKSVWLEEDLIRDVVINYIKEGGPLDALLTPTTTEE